MTVLHYYLHIDHIQVQAANTISSPLTYGFPSASSIVGAVHALNRKLKTAQPLFLDGVMIACHQCEPQIYRSNSYSDYRFNLTRNPIGRDGKPRPIIEEGKVHLDLSLVVEVCSDEEDLLADEQQKQDFITQVEQQLYRQRIAGGSIMQIGKVELIDAAKGDIAAQILRKLIPASVLMDAQNELKSITAELQTKNPDATMLDALIETAMLHHEPISNKDEQNLDGSELQTATKEEQIKWQTTSIKAGRGWIVPIPIGYQAISPLFEAGMMQGARSNSYPSQFVEAVYGLGKWVFPFRLNLQFEQAFWRYQPPQKLSNGAHLYLVNQNNHNDE